MKHTITTLQNGTFEISQEHYNILSWYATITLSSYNESKDKDKIYWQLWGLHTAGTAIGIQWELFYDIDIHKRIKGYQNMNKLSEIKIFDYNLND
jgi:hypothetical protein